MHYLSADEMAFELAAGKGKYLKARNTGIVEFAQQRDKSATFKISNSPVGHLYLQPKEYLSYKNRLGGKGWYLSMTATGQLSCDGGKDAYAEWALLSAAAAAPPPNRSNAIETTDNPLLASATTPLLPPQPPPINVNNNSAASQSATSASATFPGYNAGREALMRFFNTAAGNAFLRQPEFVQAYELYASGGLLAKLLHRPDWVLVSNRYKDYSKSSPQLDDIALETFQPIVGKQFFEDGYTVLSRACSPAVLQEANKIVNFWINKYMTNNSLVSINGLKKCKFGTVELLGDIMFDMDIMALYYESIVPHVLQRFMGKDDVDHPSFAASIVVTYPMLDPTAESPALSGDKWGIDGFTSNGDHSPYNVLIGVALTDINDVDQGNICVHPGSHLLLLEQYKDKATLKSSIFSDDPYRVQKPNLGEPVQVKMKAGDIFLCTQRLARLQSTNTSGSPTIIVYFKVSHVDHAVLKDAALQSMWLEFPGASLYVDENVANSSILMAADHNHSSAQEAPLVGTAAIVSSSQRPAYAAPVPRIPPPPNDANNSGRATAVAMSSNNGGGKMPVVLPEGEVLKPEPVPSCPEETKPSQTPEVLSFITLTNKYSALKRLTLHFCL